MELAIADDPQDVHDRKTLLQSLDVLLVCSRIHQVR